MSWNTDPDFEPFLRFYEEQLNKSLHDMGRTMNTAVVGSSAGVESGNSIIQQMRDGTPTGRVLFTRIYNTPTMYQQFQEWKKTQPEAPFVPDQRRAEKLADIMRIFKITDAKNAMTISIDVMHAIAKATEANPDVKPMLWDGKEMKPIHL
jgi:hypothetical protein